MFRRILKKHNWERPFLVPQMKVAFMTFFKIRLNIPYIIYTCEINVLVDFEEN